MGIEFVPSRTGTAALLLIAMLVASPSAEAGLTRAQLRSVGAFPPPHAMLSPSLPFRDAEGAPMRIRAALGGVPAVLLFSDFACRTLCGPILTMTSAALEQSSLRPGEDFHLIVVGLRPNGSAAQARTFVRPQLSPAIMAATRILIGTSATVGAATRALGYRYVYDGEHDQFAHPTAAFVLGGSGKLATVLSAPGLRATDVRLALLNAGDGRAETFADRLRLLCYCYDPVTGIYTAAIGRMIDAAAGATVLALGCGLWFLHRKETGRRA